MSAERAFADFVEAWERGEGPDPAAAVAAAGDDQREPLAAMIAAYLAANPRTDVTEEQVLARAADPGSEPPLAWPQLLPALRARTGTTRGALVARLAEALGHPDARAQVEEHVHGLETGQLAPARVRPPVVAALARILRVPEALLEMGRRIAPPRLEASSSAAFHRAAPAASPPPAIAEAADAPRNAEIDELFTGGG